MIYHASIPADEPERVARVIAELWRGTYHPFIARGTFSNHGATSDERDRLLGALAANIHALIVQRELVSLIHDNMQWVVQTFDVRDEALAKLGAVELSAFRSN